MIALACLLLSAAGFYLGLSLEAFWPLAWIAPIPALWFALSRRRPLAGFFVAAASYALGGLYLVQAYGEILPVSVMALALAAPALCFGIAVLGASFVCSRLGAWAGAVAFASVWTALDYALSLGPDGTALSPAYSQAAAPLLIQTSALFGLGSVTFLLGLVSAGLAASLAYRRPAILAACVAVFLLNASFGAWRMSAGGGGEAVRVGLAADDRVADAAFDAAPQIAAAAIQRYDHAARELARQGAELVVLPEKIAILTPQTREQTLARLQTLANEIDATIIAGFDDRGDPRRNRAYVFSPGRGEPDRYDKRHLIQGLEDGFLPGDRGMQFSAGFGVVICKDLDFPQTLRADARSGELSMVFAPAWDFDRDAWLHARMAILRGVENGFSVARAAKQGLLTLSDAYGRQIARAQSSGSGAVLVVGMLRRGPGPTPYTRAGDVLPWACMGLAGLLLGVAALRRRTAALA